MLAFLSGFLGVFRRRILIIGAVAVVIVLGYFYVSNMKSKIGDLQKKSGVQETVIEVKDKTIKKLTERFDRTQLEIDKLAEKVENNKEKLENIANHFDSDKIEKSTGEDQERTEKEINEKINELFKFLNEGNKNSSKKNDDNEE